MSDFLVVGTMVEANRAYDVWERAWLGCVNEDGTSASVVFYNDWDHWNDVDGQEMPVSANGASVLELAGHQLLLSNVRPLEERDEEGDSGDVDPEESSLAESDVYGGPFFIVDKPFRNCSFQLGVGDVSYLDFLEVLFFLTFRICIVSCDPGFGLQLQEQLFCRPSSARILSHRS